MSTRTQYALVQRTAATRRQPSMQDYAAVALYAAMDESTDFRLNRLTGREQSLGDKRGWLVNQAV